MVCLKSIGFEISGRSLVLFLLLSDDLFLVKILKTTSNLDILDLDDGVVEGVGL